MSMPIARRWTPDLGVGSAVLALGLWEAGSHNSSGYDGSIVPWAVAITTALAVTLARHAGWWSLGIMWAILALQAATMSDLMLVELAVVAVAFALARWGSKALLIASGLSVPFATFLGLGYIALLTDGLWQTRVARNLIVRLTDVGTSWPMMVLPMIVGVLAVPWLGGLTARYWGAARASQRSQAEAQAEALRAQRDRAQMEQIAALREDQARLARDVHDVVGHSLTVILAQAEAAQFRDLGDQAALKRTMATIAESARSSLQEVRAVLAAPGGTAAQRTDLDTLIDSSRASGHEIAVTDTGAPRPLPPELAAVAFRVLQEMLTNAIKHGRRETDVEVVRQWGDDLRITVANRVDGDAARRGPSRSNGLRGMRRRLESVGGSLEVHDATDVNAMTFTASATLPVRANRALERVSG